MQLERTLGLKLEDENKKKAATEQKLQRLRDERQTAQNSMMEKHRQERQAEQQRELQQELDKIKAEHETAKKEMLAALSKEAETRQQEKLSTAEAELEEEKSSAVTDKEKLLSYELERAESECSKEQAKLEEAQTKCKTKAAESVQSKIDDLRAKNDAEIAADVEAEAQRLSDQRKMKLEMQEMRAGQALQARLNELQKESAIATAEAIQEEKKRLAEDLEATKLAFSQELADAHGRAETELRAQVVPAVKEREAQLEAELELELAEMQKCSVAKRNEAAAVNEQAAHRFRELLDAACTAHEEEIQRCRAEVAASKAAAAEAATASKAERQVRLFQRKLEEVRAAIDEESQTELQTRLLTLDAAQQEKDKQATRQFESGTTALINDLRQTHLHDMARVAVKADSEYAAQNEKMTEEQQKQLTASLDTIRREQQAAEERDRARILKECKVEQGNGVDGDESQRVEEEIEKMRTEFVQLAWTRLSKKVIKEFRQDAFDAAKNGIRTQQSGANGPT
eukprot:SAG31_NODE_2261_length_6065_cov_2.303051_2_plen_513_part_00